MSTKPVAPLSPTDAAIRAWRIACSTRPEASCGYPKTNILWRMANVGVMSKSGAHGHSGRHDDDLADDSEVVRQVATAIGYMRWMHEQGVMPNCHDPFLAFHLNVIRGERAMRSGRPYPAEIKARILGMSRRTYYNRIGEATAFIHSYFDDGGCEMHSSVA